MPGLDPIPLLHWVEGEHPLRHSRREATTLFRGTADPGPETRLWEQGMSLNVPSPWPQEKPSLSPPPPPLGGLVLWGRGRPAAGACAGPESQGLAGGHGWQLRASPGGRDRGQPCSRPGPWSCGQPAQQSMLSLSHQAEGPSVPKYLSPKLPGREREKVKGQQHQSHQSPFNVATELSLGLLTLAMRYSTPWSPSPMPGMMWNSSLTRLSTAVVMMWTRGKA